jgi:pyruvate/oxaloacetate carboxyltransferase
MILDEINAKIPAAEAASATPPSEAAAALAGASAIASAITPASATTSTPATKPALATASASSMEQPDQAKHDEVIVLDGPTLTHDVSSSSLNCFF